MIGGVFNASNTHWASFLVDAQRKSLLDVPKLLDEIERDTGIFFEGDIDCRKIYICPMHPGAQELPYHPKEHLKASPISGIKAGGNRRKRKQQAAARAADDGSGR